jgi:hypothetical protein
VERDLLDYVSFANEFTGVAVNKKSKSNKLTNRGRGRPPLILTNVADLTNDNLVVLCPLLNVEVDTNNDVPVNIETNAHVEDTFPAVTSVCIERSHRLLGMWKGSFDIRAKGFLFMPFLSLFHIHIHSDRCRH